MTAMASPLVSTPLFQGVDKNSAGYKLLSSMGWKEGEGLGAKKQGIREHVKVKKKHDAMGVGAAETAQNLRDWTTGMVSFDRILSNLKEVTASRSAAAADSSSSDDDEEEQPEEKPKAKQAKKKTDKKKAKGAKRKRAAQSSDDSDASSSDADDDAEGSDGKAKAAAAAAAASAKRLKLASHVGRYSKRERAKFVKNYSASDLDAILGGVAGKDGAASEEVEDADAGVGAAGMLPDAMGFMPVIAEARAARTADGAASSSDDDEEGGEAGAAAARQRTVVGAADGGAREAGAGSGGRQRQRKEKQPAPPAEEEWEPGKKPWWAAMFVRAGRMGSIRQELRAGNHHGKAKINVSGFKEQDQENLYEQAQHGAAHGRQGLGRSDMPKKVAGARWCGTKTKLDDGDDDDEEARSDADPEGLSGSGSGSESEEEGRIVVVRSKTEQAAAAAAVEATAAGTAGDKAGPSGRGQALRPGKDAGGSGGQGSGGAPAAAKGKAKRKKESSWVGQGGDKAEEEQEAAAKRKEKKAKKEKKGEAAKEEAGPSAADGGDGWASSKQPKWRKLVRQLLADAPERRLKLKKLRKQLESTHGLGGGVAGGGKSDCGNECSGMAAVLEQLRGSKKFVVCDKFVTLTQ